MRIQYLRPRSTVLTGGAVRGCKRRADSSDDREQHRHGFTCPVASSGCGRQRTRIWIRHVPLGRRAASTRAASEAGRDDSLSDGLPAAQPFIDFDAMQSWHREVPRSASAGRARGMTPVTATALAHCQRSFCVCAAIRLRAGDDRGRSLVGVFEES